MHGRRAGRRGCVPPKEFTRQQKHRILSATTLKALTPPPTGSVDYFNDLTPGPS
jgi:hypothetical protein